MARERIPLGREGIDRSAERLDVLLLSRASALPPGAGGDMFSKIVLYHADKSNSEFFDVDDAGLAAAIAAVTGADHIAIPPAAAGTFTSAVTIPANTSMNGAATQSTFISNKVTMSSNSFLRDVTVLITANSGANLTGVAGPGSGSAYLNTVSIQITQSGAGDAYGIEMGAGDLFARSCFISGTSTGGTGNGIKSGAGDIFIEEGSAVQGSSTPISGTNTFSIDSDKLIRLHDITGTYNWIFSFDETGLGAAITAAASGDTIEIPDAGTLSLTSGITIPVSVTVEGGVLSFSGFSGVAITLSTGSILENITISHNGNGVNETGVLASDIDSWIVMECPILVEGGSGTNIAISCSGNTPVTRGFVNRTAAHARGGTQAIGINVLGDGSVTIAHSSGFGEQASSTNYGVVIINNASADEVFIEQSKIEALDTGAYGLYSDGDVLIENTVVKGPSASAVLDTSNSTIRACNNRWGDFDSSALGTLTYLKGDRGAYAVEDYHGEDIEDSQETRHTPAPVAQGDMIAADSNPYHAILSIGNAHEIMKVNAGGTDPAWEAFDWDEMSGVAGADMVHDHSSDAEGGGAGFDWDSVWSDAVHNHSSNAEGGTESLHEATFNEDHSAACDGAKTNFVTANEYEPETTQLQQNGSRLRIGSNNDYTEDATFDAFTLATAPLASDELIIDYVTA